MTVSETTQRLSQAAKQSRKTLLRVAQLATFAGMALAAQAAAAANELVDITHVTLSGNKQQLALTMSGPAEAPKSFTIDNPARIALDLPDTRNALDQRNIRVGADILQNITTVEAGGRTRVVVNLANMVSYTTVVQGNQVLVTLDNPENGYQTPASSLLAQAATPETTALVTADGLEGSDRSVKSIDFRRGPLGEGRILFELSNPSIVSDMREEGGRVIVEFPDTGISSELQRRLDVMDFGTPVQFIDTLSNNRGTRIVIQPATQDFEQLAYQSDTMFTVELKPMTREEIEESKKSKFGYTGEKLSLNFQDIEVRSVLQLLADFTDLNIVVSDTVQGKLTLRLKNTPWDQALDIILQTKALAKRQAGDVIMVAPAEEIANRERLELESQVQKVELAPIRTEYFQANYAKASELATLMAAQEGGGLLSERGSVTVDDRTNTLLISDTSDKLAEIRSLVHRLDIPVRQVLIESRIVIATDDFNREIGVRWGINRNTANPGGVADDDGGFALSGNSNGVTNLLNGEELAAPGRFNVNLGANNAFGSLGVALAKLPFGTLLELELSAMQAEGLGEVISSPRIITANQHEAFIEQGVEIPYLETSSGGGATISFRKAVLGLKVTPQITPDDRIIMDLTINKDTVGEIFANVPSIDTRELATQVLVDNGETVVLGGVYEQSKVKQLESVPFFGSLPLIGNLFKHRILDDDKTELLVFVTPKIVKESASLTY